MINDPNAFPTKFVLFNYLVNVINIDKFSKWPCMGAMLKRRFLKCRLLMRRYLGSAVKYNTFPFSDSCRIELKPKDCYLFNHTTSVVKNKASILYKTKKFEYQTYHKYPWTFFITKLIFKVKAWYSNLNNGQIIKSRIIVFCFFKELGIMG